MKTSASEEKTQKVFSNGQIKSVLKTKTTKTTTTTTTTTTVAKIATTQPTKQR